MLRRWIPTLTGGLLLAVAAAPFRITPVSANPVERIEPETTNRAASAPEPLLAGSFVRGAREKAHRKARDERPRRLRGEEGRDQEGPSEWRSRVQVRARRPRALPPPVYAGDCAPRTLEGRRWRRTEEPPQFDTYVLVKGGGLHISEGGGTDGMYLGLELGGTTSRLLDLGFSLDYFHRQTRDLRVLFETEGGYQFPIRGEITEFESSADLVPLGLTMRLRLPVASAAVQPFVSGTLGYEILRLGLFELDPEPRPYDDILGDSEFFSGFAWQAAAGVQVALAPAVGLFGEVGLHRSTLGQAVEVNGAPVDLRVRLDGGFLRAGLRFGI